MIRLASAAVIFGSTTILRATDLQFPAAQTTVLIGPSGSGKSTVLRLIIGLIAPTSGTVEYDGLPVREDTLPAIRRRTGYVIQEGGLFPHLTAEENVSLLSRHLNRPKEERDRRIDELCNLVRLPRALLSRYPAELSGGQRQRVSLMRALMLDPEVLLLDEPLGALDPMVRAELQRDLKSIFEKLGRTVVFVTHDLAEAVHFAGRIVLLRDGRVVQEGTAADLAARPAEPFVTEFLSAQRGAGA